MWPAQLEWHKDVRCETDSHAVLDGFSQSIWLSNYCISFLIWEYSKMSDKIIEELWLNKARAESEEYDHT